MPHAQPRTSPQAPHLTPWPLQLGDCGVECKTVERALQDIMGEHDTDVGEALFTNKRSVAQFKDWLCTELTAACKGTPPSLPKVRRGPCVWGRCFCAASPDPVRATMLWA